MRKEKWLEVGELRIEGRGEPMANKKQHANDRFLASVGALRAWLAHIDRDATWRGALASVFGCAIMQIPLPIDTAFTRGLAFVGAVRIGALAGTRLDRRKRRKPCTIVAADRVARKTRTPVRRPRRAR